MHKILFLIASFFSVSAQTHQAALPTNAFPAPVGLVMIASTSDGIAVGADSASYNADGTLSQTEKLFPVGKTGILAIAGSVSIQDPVSRPVREEVNIARIAAAWLEAHPDATLALASTEITKLVEGAANKYFATRGPGPPAKSYKFALIFTGLVDGNLAITGTKYYVPRGKGKTMRTETLDGELKAGQLWVFGQTEVEQSLAMNASSSLANFRADASVKKLRSAAKDLSLQDYLNAFDTVLRATESPEAKNILVGKQAVALPNKFAIISKDGFKWAKANWKQKRDDRSK